MEAVGEQAALQLAAIHSLHRRVRLDRERRRYAGRLAEHHDQRSGAHAGRVVPAADVGGAAPDHQQIVDALRQQATVRHIAALLRAGVRRAPLVDVHEQHVVEARAALVILDRQGVFAVDAGAAPGAHHGRQMERVGSLAPGRALPQPLDTLQREPPHQRFRLRYLRAVAGVDRPLQGDRHPEHTVHPASD